MHSSSSSPDTLLSLILDIQFFTEYQMLAMVTSQALHLTADHQIDRPNLQHVLFQNPYLMQHDQYNWPPLVMAYLLQPDIHEHLWPGPWSDQGGSFFWWYAF